MALNWSFLFGLSSVEACLRQLSTIGRDANRWLIAALVDTTLPATLAEFVQSVERTQQARRDSGWGLRRINALWLQLLVCIPSLLSRTLGNQLVFLRGCFKGGKHHGTPCLPLHMVHPPSQKGAFVDCLDERYGLSDERSIDVFARCCLLKQSTSRYYYSAVVHFGSSCSLWSRLVSSSSPFADRPIQTETGFLLEMRL